MSVSFMELFDIKEVFEQNSRQRILMGTPKNTPGEVVVINRFYRDDTFDESLYLMLKRSLKNLVHIENTVSEMVVVTSYPEGAPLTALIDSPRLLPSDRLRLAELYLDQAAAYEGLPPAFQYLLIDLNQFVVQDTGLEPKELILLDRKFNPAMESSEVSKRLSGALNLILKPNDTAYEEFESDSIRNLITGLSVGAIATLAAARGTFAGLLASSERVAGTLKDHTASAGSAQNESHGPSEGPAAHTASKTAEESAEAVGTGAKKIGAGAAGAGAIGAGAIGAGAVDKSARAIELDNLFVSEEPAKRTAPPRKKPVKKRQFKWLAWLLLIAVAALVLFGIFNILTGLFVRKAPSARFETQQAQGTYHFINKSTVSGADNKLTQISWRIEKDGTELLSSDEFDLTVTFKNTGKYKVTLMVKDRYRWSSAYSQIVEYTSEGGEIQAGTDVEPGASTGADDPLGGIQTSGVSSNVSYDSRVSRTGSQSLKLDMTASDQAQMTLDALTVSRSTALSFWMRSSTTDRVVLTVFGYDQNGLRFTKKLTLTPKTTTNWEMVTLQSNYDDITSMKLQFSAPGTILWLDNFELSAFK